MPARVRCLPAREGSGILFVRTDRPGSSPIPASVDAVSDTTRAVTLGTGNPVRTVEHLLGAAAALGVTDLRIEVDGEEIPALDGSARPFADAMRGAGFVDYEGPLPVLHLSGPHYVADGHASVLALPALELRLTYVVPLRSPVLGTQVVDVPAAALATLLDARTWGYVDDVEELRAGGLARGAHHENALGIGPRGYLSPPRGPDEPARHKVLDLLGDLSLIGRPVQAHIIAVAARHELHVEMVRRILKTETREPRDGTRP